MKRVFTFLIALTLSFSVANLAFADETEKKSNETSVQGKVIDKGTGETLAGVDVCINGTDLKTSTDLDGNFSFDNLEPGEYTLVCNYISYKEEKKMVKVASKENIKLDLSLESYSF